MTVSNSVAPLSSALDRLYADYNREDSAADPVNLVRPFARREDREVAGFCAAALAFGRVASVLASISTLFRILGDRPGDYVRSFVPSAPHPELYAMVHRWTRGRDLAALLWILRQMQEQSGSIDKLFAEGLSEEDVDVGAALDGFSRRALALDVRRVYGRVPKRAGVRYFFPSPALGSACKRLNLFLRWMVRRDAIDPGGWTSISPRQLVVPLDTHTIRVGRCLRLTRRATPGGQMASEITAGLRRFDRDDPVRYDFALCHLSMMGGCGFGARKGNKDCPLREACRPGQSRRPRAKGRR